jgi:hypothetical protein
MYFNDMPLTLARHNRCYSSRRSQVRALHCPPKLLSSFCNLR